VLAGEALPLFDAIDAYAGGRDILVLDCSRLARMDYACASALQARLRVHLEAGKRVELRELNHLVATLLRLLGAEASLKLYPHRY
jgi:ABC-type transporter Mla MlaB component